MYVCMYMAIQGGDTPIDSVLPSVTTVKMQVTRQKHKMSSSQQSHTIRHGQQTTKVLKPTIKSSQ